MEVGSAEWKKLVIDGAAELNVSVTDEQAGRFAVHAAEMIFWNHKVNLTAVETPLDMAVKHYLDAVVPAPLIPRGAALLDVGSGAGFPGIPLKIIMPSLSVTLIDASRKKVAFLNHVIRVLQLTDIRALHLRIEQMQRDQDRPGTFDVVVCRAFSGLERFVNLSLPLLKGDGRLIALKGREAQRELNPLTVLVNGAPMLRARTESAGGVFLELKTVRCLLPHLNLLRTLVVLKKAEASS